MSATPDEITRLRAELAEVLQREAALRERTTREILELQARLQPLTTVIGERGVKLHEQELALGEVRSEIHRLNLKLQAIHGDLESFVWMLHQAESKAGSPWELLRRTVSPGPKAVDSRLPGGDFIYYLETSPYRLYRSASFTLRGWAFPRDGRPVTALRVRVAGREFSGRMGLPAPDALAQHGAQPNNPAPGFEIPFDTPPGKHWLRLEACLAGNDWRSILNTPIWCRPEKR